MCALSVTISSARSSIASGSTASTIPVPLVVSNARRPHGCPVVHHLRRLSSDFARLHTVQPEPPQPIAQRSSFLLDQTLDGSHCLAFKYNGRFSTTLRCAVSV